MPRWTPTVLTYADMKNLCYEAQLKGNYNQSGLISLLRPGFSDDFDGKKIEMHFEDGKTLCCRFSAREVYWAENGGPEHREHAEILPGSEDVYLIHFMRTHVVPFEAATLIIDCKTCLVTWIHDELGTIHANRDVERTVRFGWIGERPEKLHCLDDGMVGSVIDWKFADHVIVHSMYESSNCCAFVSPAPPSVPEWAGFFTTFNPSKYVRIRENYFAISFRAPGTTGMEVTMLMDLCRLKAVGSVFGVDDKDQLRSYTFGAQGAFADVGFVGRYAIE